MYYIISYTISLSFEPSENKTVHENREFWFSKISILDTKLKVLWICFERKSIQHFSAWSSTPLRSVCAIRTSSSRTGWRVTTHRSLVFFAPVSSKLKTGKWNKPYIIINRRTDILSQAYSFDEYLCVQSSCGGSGGPLSSCPVPTHVVPLCIRLFTTLQQFLYYIHELLYMYDVRITIIIIITACTPNEDMNARSAIIVRVCICMYIRILYT